MLILSFIKRKDGLPDPKGPLSAAIPSQAIALANREVEKVISEEASRRPYSNGIPILSIVSFSHAHQYLANRSVPLSFVHVVSADTASSPVFLHLASLMYYTSSKKIFRAFNFRTVAYRTKIFSHKNLLHENF